MLLFAENGLFPERLRLQFFEVTANDNDDRSVWTFASSHVTARIDVRFIICNTSGRMRNLDPGDFSYDTQIAILVSSCLAVCSCRSLEMGHVIVFTAYNRLSGHPE